MSMLINNMYPIRKRPLVILYNIDEIGLPLLMMII